MIENVISQVVSGIDGDYDFQFAEQGEQNLMADGITKQYCIYLDGALSGSAASRKAPGLEITFNLGLFFAFKSEPDWNEVQRRPFNLELFRAIAQFRRLLIARPEVVRDGVGALNLNRVKNVFDANWDGWVVRIPAKFKDPFDSCYTLPQTPSI